MVIGENWELVYYILTCLSTSSFLFRVETYVLRINILIIFKNPWLNVHPAVFESKLLWYYFEVSITSKNSETKASIESISFNGFLKFWSKRIHICGLVAMHTIIHVTYMATATIYWLRDITIFFFFFLMALAVCSEKYRRFEISNGNLHSNGYWGV